MPISNRWIYSTLPSYAQTGYVRKVLEQITAPPDDKRVTEDGMVVLQWNFTLSGGTHFYNGVNYPEMCFSFRLLKSPESWGDFEMGFYSADPPYSAFHEVGSMRWARALQNHIRGKKHDS